ncbi:hypothetical protein L6452_33017 [Arctium lappa]|uniref:Uncharacterized protein n=1 Tax=Arctium lappa TaxID=4217 RepID=A0ACB8Z650_ARCLA|nr:hypothetical protein L6452_33017 [Arctium lappa]
MVLTTRDSGERQERVTLLKLGERLKGASEEIIIFISKWKCSLDSDEFRTKRGSIDVLREEIDGLIKYYKVYNNSKNVVEIVMSLEEREARIDALREEIDGLIKYYNECNNSGDVAEFRRKRGSH